MEELKNVLARAVLPCPDFHSWKAGWCQPFSEQNELEPEASLVEAFYDGCRADRMAWAFSCGYQWAIRSLIPSFMNDRRVLALCITEEGGGHPRSIHSLITEKEVGVELSGRKQFVSGGTGADVLLVAATTGQEIDGRPELKILVVPAESKGVTLQAMAALPMIPEVPHAIVRMDNVRLGIDAILSGDGYSDYIRRFRLLEDLHVQAALLGMALRKSQQLDRPELSEQALGLWTLLKGCREQGESPMTALAMAGMERFLMSLLDNIIEALPDDEKQAWRRDCALLNVAAKARAARRKKSHLWLNSVNHTNC